MSTNLPTGSNSPFNGGSSGSTSIGQNSNPSLQVSTSTQAQSTNTTTPITHSARRIQRLKSVISHVGNVIAVLAALAAAYAAFEIAMWTAAKEYRDDCRGQYAMFNAMSPDCERALHSILSPPLGLGDMIREGRKRDILEHLFPDTMIEVPWRRLPRGKLLLVTYLCLVVIAIDSVVRVRRVLICLWEWASNFGSTGADVISSGSAITRTHGHYEHSVGTLATHEPQLVGQDHELQELSLRRLVPVRDILLENLHHTEYQNQYVSPAKKFEDPTPIDSPLYLRRYQNAYQRFSPSVLQSPIHQVTSSVNNMEQPPVDLANQQNFFNGRRRRGNLPKPVTDILRDWFVEHLDHPYPSEEDKMMFIEKTGLTISQISNWFINARRRHWPAINRQREDLGFTNDSEHRVTTLQF